METYLILALFSPVPVVFYLFWQRVREQAQAAEQTFQKQLEQQSLASQAQISAEKSENLVLAERLVQSEKELQNQILAAEKGKLELRFLEEKIQKAESDLNAQREALEIREAALIQAQEKQAGLSPAEAKAEVLKSWENRLSAQIAGRIRAFEAHLQEKQERMAAKILAQAIQRQALSHVVDYTVSVVSLPHDNLKGRIIGREGRNIRTFELATGAEILIDDTPQVVVVSCFDPIRREVARRSLEILVKDGRIHPTRIEEVVLAQQESLTKELDEEGAAAAFELNIQGLHPEILRLVGRLKYRASYGQNILVHSKEVALAAGMMAAELGGNIAVARRAGLLHDLGKALTHEEVGTHTALGVDAARKYGEKPEVLHAMAAHHFDVEPQTLEAILVQVADTLSAARPGARSEPIERYIQRVGELEALVSQFPGVDKAFVVQAGREVRVIIDPDQISEDQMLILNQEIVAAIEQQLDYPGQIRVSLIRELRTTRYAK